MKYGKEVWKPIRERFDELTQDGLPDREAAEQVAAENPDGPAVGTIYNQARRGFPSAGRRSPQRRNMVKESVADEEQVDADPVQLLKRRVASLETRLGIMEERLSAQGL